MNLLIWTSDVKLDVSLLCSFFPLAYYSPVLLCSAGQRKMPKRLYGKEGVCGGKMTVLHVFSNTQKEPVHMTVPVSTAVRNAKPLFNHKHFLSKRGI